MGYNCGDYELSAICSTDYDYDDDDFIATEVCCICGGGSSVDPTISRDPSQIEICWNQIEILMNEVQLQNEEIELLRMELNVIVDVPSGEVGELIDPLPSDPSNLSPLEICWNEMEILYNELNLQDSELQFLRGQYLLTVHGLLNPGEN